MYNVCMYAWYIHTFRIYLQIRTHTFKTNYIQTSFPHVNIVAPDWRIRHCSISPDGIVPQSVSACDKSSHSKILQQTKQMIIVMNLCTYPVSCSFHDFYIYDPLSLCFASYIFIFRASYHVKIIQFIKIIQISYYQNFMPTCWKSHKSSIVATSLHSMSW